MDIKRIKRAKGFLFDLDGVFIQSDRLLPGALKTIQVLENKSIPFRFLTNTTTHNIDGKEIKEYLSVVAGEAISGANFVKDFLASIKDFTGGRSGAYEEELSKARNIAFDEMNQKAREMGANGVVGIDIDYGTLGDTGSMLMVSVNGTAIKY